MGKEQDGEAKIPRRVVIDTDPGLDDALALILAFRSPELQVEAITTVSGNVPVDQATRNVATILKMLDVETWPIVARGAARPLNKPLVTAQTIHGADGMGDLHRFKNPDGSPVYGDPELPASLPHADEVLLELVDRRPEELTLIALGPLTNLARAVEAAPGRMKRLRQVVIMGGAIAVPGNVTPVSEFNIHVDPHAAQAVFTSGLRITLVPLDVTRRVRLNRRDIETLADSMEQALGRFVRNATANLLEYTERAQGAGAVTLHDPLAVGAVIDPTLVKTTPLHVEVETEGRLTEGMTVADLRVIRDAMKASPNVEAALEVDVEGFLALFEERLCRRSW